MPELGGLSRRIESGRAEGDRQLDLLVDLTERLDRLPRHISMHPCGVILGDATLLHRTPVQPSGMGLPMSQFDKHDMDPMGFLKLDILGVRMQSAIAYTIAEVERTTGERIDLEQVPLDDPATYAMIRTTHTLGCFQIESPGQRELVGKLAPASSTTSPWTSPSSAPAPCSPTWSDPSLNSGTAGHPPTTRTPTCGPSSPRPTGSPSSTNRSCAPWTS